MKEQIKNLRIEIDGLSQLVKELRPQQWIINLESIPSKMDALEIIELLKQNSPLIPVTNVKDIKPLEQHEISKCYDSLILAKAWLGKLLGELGEDTPYANDGKRKSVEDIEAAADKKGLPEFPVKQMFPKDLSKSHITTKLNHIEKVDWLRQEIDKLIKIVISDFNNGIFKHTTTREFAIARANSYNHLCEARFWLGFELGRIRETSGSNI